MEFQCGNIFIRVGTLKNVGDFLGGHSHNFDHATYITSGYAKVERELPNGKMESREVWAGELPLLIKAGVRHNITALLPNTTYNCIYSHRLPQGEITQQYTGWQDAYS